MQRRIFFDFSGIPNGRLILELYATDFTIFNLNLIPKENSCLLKLPLEIVNITQNITHDYILPTDYPIYSETNTNSCFISTQPLATTFISDQPYTIIGKLISGNELLQDTALEIVHSGELVQKSKLEKESKKKRSKKHSKKKQESVLSEDSDNIPAADDIQVSDVESQVSSVHEIVVPEFDEPPNPLSRNYESKSKSTYRNSKSFSSVPAKDDKGRVVKGRGNLKFGVLKSNSRDNYEHSRHEKYSRDYPDREYKSRDYPEREYKSRDYPEREYKSRDYSDREYKSRDYSDREYKSRDYSEREYKSRDYPERNYERNYERRNYKDYPERKDDHSESNEKVSGDIIETKNES